MKITVNYGLAGAALGAVQVLVLFFLGLHGERIHLLNETKISLPVMLIGFAISTLVVVLGIRAVRAAAPGGGLTYGRGVGAGCLIGLWQGLGSMVFMILYGYAINPGFKDAMVANTLEQMRAKNVPAEAFPMAEKMMNVTMSPLVQGLLAVPGTVIYALIVALIAAAVLKRQAVAEPGAPVPPLA